jgi:hypothetical protein
MEHAAHAGAPHTSDARTARTVHALLGDTGTIGEGRRAVGYAWHIGCNAYHIAPRRAYGRDARGYTDHMPWDMNGRRYATRAANALHVARIGEHHGTYATLTRTDPNRMR